ncbi:RNA-directed DNA polymerase [Candidatus Berkelbacteria bacterium]|nr:RNA-directed DNA polymerase [Candidatus Berkelbacteria bacterium]
MPIGNLTSQLFANIYLDELDQFVKHELLETHYLRYTDDFILLHQDPAHLRSLIPRLEQFLTERLRLALHPRKVILRKLRRGIDFLGYVVLPHHRVLRTRTKRRMLRRVTRDNLPSYLGLLQHCHGYQLTQVLNAQVAVDQASD